MYICICIYIERDITNSICICIHALLYYYTIPYYHYITITLLSLLSYHYFTSLPRRGLPRRTSKQ